MNTEPTCYRHPDRVTYILCNRCGNNICTECMVPAPVGFQCPDCVRAGRVRVVTEFVPRVTYTIIGICVVLQALPLIGINTPNGFIYDFSLWPRAVASGQPERTLTSIFLHGGWLHLGMNMYMLLVMGRQLEAVLGRLRYLVLFLLAGMGGSLASYFFNGLDVPSVGASGAIFGLFSAIFMFGRERGLNTQEIAAIVGLNLLIGFIVPGIDWHAHVGGLVTGAIVGWALLPQRPKVLQILVPIVVLGAIYAGIGVRTAELQGIFY